MQTEYRQATAFETLIGWWYKHDKARFDYFMEIINQQLKI
jgi:23S rRNA maturation mini-RNase III